MSVAEKNGVYHHSERVARFHNREEIVYTIMYAEINTMTSYCHVCGCTDIKMGDDLKFHCPNCGNDDFNKMNIALRICGYISTNPFNDGRAQDIHDRVYHVGAD